jgi:DnaJ family protein C protein 28
MTHKSVDEQIRRAMQEGAFDNLPGKGKPLRLEDNPHADPEWRLAYQALQSSGYSLPWIETRKEIEAAVLAARQALRRSWEWRQAQAGQPAGWVEAEWQRACAVFGEQLTEINRRIQSFNLEAPSERFQMPLLKLERELELTASPPSDTLPGSDA